MHHFSGFPEFHCKTVQTLTKPIDPREVSRIPNRSFEVLLTMEKLRQVIDLIHRANSYFLARILYGDVSALALS